MTPEMLRLLTDPKALQDPEQLKAFRAEQERELRRRVLGSLRINSLILTILGALALTASVGLTSLVLLAPGKVPNVPIVGCVLPGLIGGLFLFLGRRMSPGFGAVLRAGVPRTAIVREVKSLTRNMGVKLPGVSATAGFVTCVLSVSSDVAGSVDVEHSEFIVGSDLRYLKIGSTLPVRCLAHDPRKLAIDWDAVTS